MSAADEALRWRQQRGTENMRAVQQFQPMIDKDEDRRG
jgi:hypothetical protein